MRTLVLDQGYQPHRVVSWQRAITMLFDGKVEVIEEYDHDIRSVTFTIKMPAVVRLLRAVRGKRGVKFSRINVAARDDFRCQYCGSKAPLHKLTYDHVVPRSQGGRTCWENIVMACYPCNGRKGHRTPAQAGMRLAKPPVTPAWLPVVAFRIDSTCSIPEAWTQLDLLARGTRRGLERIARLSPSPRERDRPFVHLSRSRGACMPLSLSRTLFLGM